MGRAREIFLTGGTGYVGGAVLRALVERGHRVTALVRRAGRLGDPGGARLREIVGDLRQPESFAGLASEAEAIVHCALEYGPDGERRDLEVATVGTLLEASAAGTPGHLVYTSSLFETPVNPGARLSESVDGLTGWRAGLERRVVDAGGAVIRLAFVYGGSGGYLWEMLAPGPKNTIRFATRPEGTRWPFVHVDDLAALYALAVEARASGVFHGAAGEPVPVPEVAAIVGSLVGAEPERLPAEGIEEILGGVGVLMMKDVAPETGRAAEALGWRPEHPSFPDAAAEAHRGYLAARSGRGS
jgi:nucleoside-diphosphate-sugar epimerase